MKKQNYSKRDLSFWDKYLIPALVTFLIVGCVISFACLQGDAEKAKNPPISPNEVKTTTEPTPQERLVEQRTKND